MPDEKDVIEIAQRAVMLFNNATDKEYAEYAYYSAKILARELIALNGRVNKLIDELDTYKKIVDTAGAA